MKKFTLINKERNRIKVFEPFEDVSKPSLSINATIAAPTLITVVGWLFQRLVKNSIKEL